MRAVTPIQQTRLVTLCYTVASTKSVESMDENEFIDRLLAGDEAAYRLLIGDYQHRLRQLAAGIVGEVWADEVMQDSWISVIKALPRFERRSSLKTWLFRIVSNSAKTRLRHEARNVSLDALSGGDDDGGMEERFSANGHWLIPPHKRRFGDNPEDLLSTEQLRAALETGLDALPPLQKTALILREREGMGIEDICKVLDVSESNARVLIHRARSKLWQVVDKSDL